MVDATTTASVVITSTQVFVVVFVVVVVCASISGTAAAFTSLQSVEQLSTSGASCDVVAFVDSVGDDCVDVAVDVSACGCSNTTATGGDSDKDGKGVGIWVAGGVADASIARELSQIALITDASDLLDDCCCNNVGAAVAVDVDDDALLIASSVDAVDVCSLLSWSSSGDDVDVDVGSSTGCGSFGAASACSEHVVLHVSKSTVSLTSAVLSVSLADAVSVDGTDMFVVWSFELSLDDTGGNSVDAVAASVAASFLSLSTIVSDSFVSEWLV